MIKNLKALRKEYNISQQQLANIVGVSQQSINKYENHNVEPDIETLKAIATFFNTTIDFLVGFDESKTAFTKEDELLRLFSLMTKEQQDLYIEQGKIFAKMNNKK
ncbi:MAG: helix-turn-helix domain-containing protein [Eubacterium sp.]|jgi:transcriptional regulator with XRE-family HTH domain